MNDAPQGMPRKAPIEVMEKAVLEGRRVLERIEDGWDKLNEVWGRGLSLGMMTQKEHDKFVKDTSALKEKTLKLHVRGTRIAQKNKADGPLPLGGPGR